MRTRQPDTLDRVAADSGSLATHLGMAASPSNSTFTRIGSTVAAAKLGMRVVPAAWRLVVRYPGPALLVLLAAAAVTVITEPSLRGHRKTRRARRFPAGRLR